MGAGKTTIGKLVAEKLNRIFIDTDEEIEKAYQLPVSDIFQVYGEKSFREKEKEIIIKLSEKGNSILSLGGGAFIQEEIREACLKNCIVFYLHLPWENWVERIPLLIDSRPVLHGKSLSETEKLFHSREEYYSCHHFKTETANKNPEEISSQIMAELHSMWER